MRLNGVWDDVQIRDVEKSVETQRADKVYSWGTGRYVPNESVETDLGVHAPYLSFPGFGRFKPVSVTGTEAAVHFKGTNLNETASAQSADLLMTVHADGTMTLSGKIGSAVIGASDYYSTYGPPGNS